MTTVHRIGPDRHEAYVKGSPQAVLERTTAAWWDREEVPATEMLRARVTAANDAMAAEGLRVLAIARRVVTGDRPRQDEAESGLTLLGLVAMSDPPRAEVVDAVAACGQAGIRIYMVTGDYGLTAEAIARKVGIVTKGPVRILSAADLDAMTDDQLADMTESGEQLLFARVRPEHKMRIVGALEGRGEVVAVTGDGVNDAPSLKRASIGVSMGEGVPTSSGRLRS